MPQDLDYIVTKAQFAENLPLTNEQWEDLCDYLDSALEHWFDWYYEAKAQEEE